MFRPTVMQTVKVIRELKFSLSLYLELSSALAFMAVTLVARTTFERFENMAVSMSLEL